MNSRSAPLEQTGMVWFGNVQIEDFEELDCRLAIVDRRPPGLIETQPYRDGSARACALAHPDKGLNVKCARSIVQLPVKLTLPQSSPTALPESSL